MLLALAVIEGPRGYDLLTVSVLEKILLISSLQVEPWADARHRDL